MNYKILKNILITLIIMLTLNIQAQGNSKVKYSDSDKRFIYSTSFKNINKNKINDFLKNEVGNQCTKNVWKILKVDDQNVPVSIILKDQKIKIKWEKKVDDFELNFLTRKKLRDLCKKISDLVVSMSLE